MFLNVDWNVPGHFRDSLRVWKRSCLFAVLLIHPGADHPSLFDWFLLEVSVRGETDRGQWITAVQEVNFWVKYSNQNIMFFMAAPFDQTEKSSAKYLFSILTKKVKSVCGDGRWEVCGFQVLSTENFENSSNSAVERFHLQVCWWAVSGFLLLQLLWVGGLRGFPHACSGGFGLAAAILIKIKWLGICKSSHLLIVAANPS